MEWFHAEDVFDSDTKAEFAPKLEEQWHSRFAGRENDDMSVTSKYLVQEADATGNSMKSVVTADDVPGLIELLEDAKHFKKTYSAKVQMTFNRVQHHMHKRTKKGYIPLKSCQRKTRKNARCASTTSPKTDYAYLAQCSYVVESHASSGFRCPDDAINWVAC